MASTPLRFVKATGALSVKGLALVLFGWVFGGRFGGCRQAENTRQSVIGFDWYFGVQSAGQSGASSGQFRPIQCSGSWRHGSCWSKVSGVGIRVGCWNESPGNRHL